MGNDQQRLPAILVQHCVKLAQYALTEIAPAFAAQERGIRLGGIAIGAHDGFLHGWLRYLTQAAGSDLA
ncbi:hypothetical protein D3C85_1739900 [compost metagenome]